MRLVLEGHGILSAGPPYMELCFPNLARLHRQLVNFF